MTWHADVHYSAGMGRIVQYLVCSGGTVCPYLQVFTFTSNVTILVYYLGAYPGISQLLSYAA